MRKLPEPKPLDEILKDLAEAKSRKTIQTRLSFYQEATSTRKQQITIHTSLAGARGPVLSSRGENLAVDELKKQFDNLPQILAALTKLGIDPTKL
jgi:hypothetical protein